jgi:hypothetical protein
MEGGESLARVNAPRSITWKASQLALGGAISISSNTKFDFLIAAARPEVSLPFMTRWTWPEAHQRPRSEQQIQAIGRP